MYKCPICGCCFDISENGIKTMTEKGRGNDPDLNPIIVCCPNNDGYSIIYTGYANYNEEGQKYYDISSWEVGVTYIPNTPPNVNEIKGTFIGKLIK